MTGCLWCGVGSDDDCTADCPSRESAPGELDRLVARVADRLPMSVQSMTTTRSELGAVLEFDGVKVAIMHDEGSSKWGARVVSDSGLTLCAVGVESPHWLQSAVVISAMVNEFVF